MVTAEPTSTSTPTLSGGRAELSTSARLKEWRWVIGITALVMLLTSMPYLFANATAPADKHFMGLMLDVPDHIQYFSWMRDLSTANLVSNRLTAEPNSPAYFNLLWWVLGRFGAISGLDYSDVFTVLRLLAVVVCLGCSYAFLKLVIPDLKQRRIAFVLIALGGGLGIVWIFAKYLLRLPGAPYPFDVYTAEPNTFLTFLGYPHFALALGLIVATFGLVLLALRKHQLRYAFAAGGVALVLGLQHAYDLVTIYAVLGLFGLLIWLRDRRFPTFLFICGLVVVGISAPPAAYFLLLVKANPIWGAVLEQFDLAGAFTPNPLHLPILLGIPLLLALAVFRPRMLQSRNDVELFTATWFVAHFALAYLPLDFQIHLLLGWQIPLAILAASALTTRVGPAIANRLHISRRVVIGSLVALCLVTNLYILVWRFVDLRRYDVPYFLSTDEVAALDWLAEHATTQDVVLARLDFGQYVPMWSDARAFLAHWTGTVDFHKKMESVDAFFSIDTPALERVAVLTDSDVSYIVAQGEDIQTLTSRRFTAEAAGALDLVPMFTQGRVAVYGVQTW